MTYQEYNEKLKRGLAQVRAGQGIVKTMEELERMAEETRFAQLQLPDPTDHVKFWILAGIQRSRLRLKQIRESWDVQWFRAVLLPVSVKR